MSTYIDIDTFDMQVTVITSNADKKAMGWDPDDLGMAGYNEEQNAFFIVLPAKWDESTTYHEAHHMARFINEHHGIKTTAQDHEADAYLMEYIVRQIKTTIYKRKL